MPRTGVRVIFNRFPELAVALPHAVDAACSETATAIEQDVKGGGPNAAPILTGNLRRSYHKEKKGTADYQVGNDPDVAEYALFVEYGTYKMAAQPHLRPATEAQRAPFKRRVAAALRAIRVKGR